MTEQIPKKINVLMVEDNPADAFLTKEILSESENAAYQITTINDAVNALAFLHKLNGFEDAPRPDLILLDLNLPKMHGLDFLARIRDDKYLTTMPVVILTTSEFGGDMERARELGVRGYLAKPIDLDEFESVILR